MILYTYQKPSQRNTRYVQSEERSGTTRCPGLLGPLDSPTSTRIFPETAFFIKQRASALPLPAEIRALNTKSGTHMRKMSIDGLPSSSLHYDSSLIRSQCNRERAKTQVWLRELLGDTVPTPEVFGWAEDGKQTFISMFLVKGWTLQESWDSINEHDRHAICY
jgi:hypothetical protein